VPSHLGMRTRLCATAATAVLALTLAACTTAEGSDDPSSTKAEASTQAPMDEAEIEDDPTDLGQQAGKWGQPATSADGLHTFVASEPVAEKVTDDDHPDKKLDGVRIDLAYTNNSDATVDALWDVQLTTFSAANFGEPEWCEGYEGGRYEEPVPSGRTFEWSECFAVEDPEDVVLTIAPPMAEDGSIVEIIYGGQ